MTDTARGELHIGEVTARTGLSAHALRFYERQGLMPYPVRRSSSGRRLFTDDDVMWLRNCTRFRASGMPLATIRRFAELVRHGPGNEQERLEILVQHERLVTDRIAELQECRALIRDKVAAYRSSVTDGNGDPWYPG